MIVIVGCIIQKPLCVIAGLGAEELLCSVINYVTKCNFTEITSHITVTPSRKLGACLVAMAWVTRPRRQVV